MEDKDDETYETETGSGGGDDDAYFPSTSSTTTTTKEDQSTTAGPSNPANDVWMKLYQELQTYYKKYKTFRIPIRRLKQYKTLKSECCIFIYSKY